MRNNYFLNFEKQIAGYSNNAPFCPSLLMKREGQIEYYYSPFDYINTDARIVLVGMSPGPTQAHNANVAAKQILLSGGSAKLASKTAKETGSFSGALRNNLVSMLDSIGVQHRLGIVSCESLFTTDKSLLHSTSVFRYPTLVNGKAISSAKQGLKTPILKDMVDTYLLPECLELNKSALYIPLGQGVEDVLRYLVKRDVISDKQILNGLPHPSGANAERISYFLGRKKREALSIKTNADKLDEAKKNLLSKMALA